jgi:hypothetical protein
VLWNALAPELWRRTTIAVQRALVRLVGVQEGELRRLVRVSYAKVAQFQRRGAVHFHAVIRLDAATDCRCPGCLAPPPEPFTAGLLEEALRQAVPAVRVPCPPVDAGPGRYARWGEQLDVRNITTGEDEARGAVGRAGRRLHRQVRHQGHRELRRRTRPAHRRRRPGPSGRASGACGGVDFPPSRTPWLCGQG